MLTATGTGLAAGLAGCTDGGGQQETELPTSGGGGQQETESPTSGGGGGTTDGGGDSTPSDSRYVQPGDTGNEVHILTDYSNDPWQNRWKNELTPAFDSEPNISTNVEYMGVQGTDEQRLQEGKELVAENL